MIITAKKPFREVLKSLNNCARIFLVGCGECATVCQTGGKDQLQEMQEALEKEGKVIVGTTLPDAPCLASQIKAALAKNAKVLEKAEAVLVLACGLGVQSVKENERRSLMVLPACDTLFGAVMDAKGNFYEKCSFCGECVLEFTAGICPITLCPKGLLNGPCGGMDKGKCETDKDKDCAWVLIYKELEKRNKLVNLKEVKPPKDFKKMNKPRKLILVS